MNRLRALELEGFQTLKRRVRVELPEITLLYGPNSAGKSAVLDAIELFRIVSNIKSFDSKKLFTCIDRWASWLSIDRYEDIYEQQRAEKIDPVPIRTCSIAAEFDLEIADPWSIDPSEFSSSLRHIKRSLQFGGDDFVAQLREFVSKSADGGAAKLAMTFSIRGEGANAFEDDFFCNSIEISLAGKPIASLIQEPFEQRARINPIYSDPLALFLYDSWFADLVIPESFRHSLGGIEEIKKFRVESKPDVYYLLTRLPQQNYLQLDPIWNDGSDEITKALAACFEDIMCYFLGGLQEILSESQAPFVADYRIPEAEDVSGVVEMRFT